jgi:hypothetical protein
MNEQPPQAVPIDTQKCLEAMEQMTALVKHIHRRRQNNVATFSTTEPTTPLAQFLSSGGDLYRANKAFRAAIQSVVKHERLNQKNLNRLAAFEQEAARDEKSLETLLLDISVEVDGFSDAKPVEPEPPGPADWWKDSEDKGNAT